MSSTRREGTVFSQIKKRWQMFSKRADLEMKLISTLTDDKLKAIEAVSADRAAWAITPLIHLMLTDTDQIGVAAARALGVIGDKSANLGLKSALHKGEATNWSEVRTEAALALIKLGDLKVIEELIGFFLKYHEQAHHIERTLLAIGAPLVIEPLIVALQDNHPDIQSGAAKTLEKIGLDKIEDSVQRENVRRRIEVLKEQREHMEANRGVLILDNYWSNDQDGTTYKSCGTCGSKAKYSMGMGPSNDHLYKVGKRCPQCGTLFTKEMNIDHY